MYSGSTLTPISGGLLGAHQKIDRLARRSLGELLPKKALFPSAKAILHFEGDNGPDAIKRKSPARDEPWHYYSPFDDSDRQLLDQISNHYDALVRSLKEKDEVRAAFESAWMAHAIVDGLTPAHHFPYEERLSELRGGESLDTRTSYKAKLLMPGATRRQQVRNNWHMWGPNGLLTQHVLFEWGVALIIASLRAKKVAVTIEDLASLRQYGTLELFRRTAREIAALDLYTKYQKTGWTPALSRQVRYKLAPTITRMVTLAWYAAAVDAGLFGKKS